MKNRSLLTIFAPLRLCGIILFLTAAAAAQVPAPKDTLGFTPGDDRKLASWASIVDYFTKLDAASDRVMFWEIGKTTMGAPFVYATISSPENLKQIRKYEDINAKLADPRKIAGTRAPLPARDAAAKKLIAQGKTIVLITCGVHSTEVGSTLSSMLIAHRLASATDAETKKILDNTIILLVPSLNPDGVDIVKNWYDKTLGTPYEGTEPPELYHKYVGHDNNRDWYAFTQVETQLTVDRIHNVWHPQIVHDIHQQGANGARLFLPPYMQPVEPNVPKQIIEGYTELGNAMAADLRKKGFEGITTDSTYDAWTPARAYSHYHGGVRILSETASARLATPITVKFEDLRGSEGYDAKKESPNFGPVWKGGEWKLRNITDTMTTAAFSLLTHAADNREKWLSRFYEIGKEAVRPRKDGEVASFLLPRKGNYRTINDRFVDDILERAGVETEVTQGFFYKGEPYPSQSRVIYMDQPYAAFAKALLEDQKYPDLKDGVGNPIPPYDVTAHTIPLLTGVRAIAVSERTRFPALRQRIGESDSDVGCISNRYVVQLYRSEASSMDEGWTRWILGDQKPHRSPYFHNCEQLSSKSLRNSQLRQNVIEAKVYLGGTNNSVPGTIIFPDQSPSQILNGYAKGSMPDEYTGGVGKEGVENLKKFVEAGGTLVFLNRSSDFAIEQFNLPIRDVTKGLNRKDFFIPGSILRTELDLTSPIAKGMPKESIAWFENGPAFEVWSPGFSRLDANQKPPEGGTPNVTIIARYPSDPKQILLSGWALGAERIAGKAALVEVKIGKGKIILFGFRPQYRGQSLATFPLLFNAISN
ncbi:MAG: hypothetical protein KA447_09550 [Pyrinomonadaceae bacterium]|nr:hypothetical protein [Pyrinomonadaceae bacterium]